MFLDVEHPNTYFELIFIFFGLVKSFENELIVRSTFKPDVMKQ